MLVYLAAAAGAFVLLLLFIIAISLRTVVSTNDVHIVQSGRKTVSYGKDQPAGNVYYAWPYWVPLFGIRIIQLPVSVFDIQLQDYAAYDKGRVPFVVDIMAFFRIEDSNVAAQRVSSFKELQNQLQGILQGASRSILAQAPIEEILEERAKYGQMFTDVTNEQLKHWGVANVKNIELMDIRDAQGSKVISNIMAVKQSLIEKDSRVSVAKNRQEAEVAEIEAQRQVAVSKQEADQQVGVRAAQKEQAVGIASQQAEQQIKEAQKETAERDMAVKRVQAVREAEIQRDKQVVGADQEKQTAVIRAEGEKQKTITTAEGELERAKLNAQGVEVEGKAKGAAEQAVLMAPVNAQIALAKEIGENDNYQTYLISLRKVEAAEVVGSKAAEALRAADVKVITNAGSPVQGLNSVMDLFTAQGGTSLGAALEAIAQTPMGREITKKLGIASEANGSGSERANGKAS